MTQAQKAKEIVAKKQGKCQGTTRKGKSCNHKAVKDGFCAMHHPEKKGRKQVEIAQPEDGFETLVGAVSNPVPSEITEDVKVDYVNGQLVEIPTIKEVDEVIEEVLDHAEEVVAQKEEGAAEELKSYKDLLVNVPEQFINDNASLTLHIAKNVASLSDEKVMKQSESTTNFINKLSYELKEIRQNAKAEYGKNLPVEETKEIERREREIFILQVEKGMLMARVDEIESVDVITADDVYDDEPSFFAEWMNRISEFFKKHGQWVGVVALLIPALVVILFGSAEFNELPNDGTSINQTPITVIEEGNVPPASVDEVIPTDNADKSRFAPVVTEVPAVSVDTHVVQSGDTLWDVAEDVYGDGSRWTEIYLANSDTLVDADSRNIDNPGHWIYPGQVLDIPVDNSALNDH